MKFVQYLPDYSELASTKMYAHPKGKGRKRLTLAVDHLVSGEVGGRDRTGSARLEYHVDFNATTTVVGGMSNETSYYIGVQSSDYLAAQYEAVRSRTGYAAQHFDTGRFDQCAFLFVLGAAQMAGAAGVPIERTGSVPTYRTLSTGFSIPGISEIGLGPEMFKDAHEFLTIMTLAGSAGVRKVQLLTDLVPGEESTLLTGTALSRYALKVAANILYSANSCGVFGCHYAAYIQGMLSVATVNAHSDEGGWVRSLLTSPTYPRPTGTIFGVGREFAGLPLQEKLPAREMLRTSLGQMFEALALLPIADLNVNGEFTVVVRDPSSDGRVNDYPELPGSASLVLHEWRVLLSDLFGAHRDGVNQRGCFNHYYQANRVDRHFSNECIVPWYFFEPTPFLVKDYPSFEKFAKIDGITTLPLFKAKAVSHTREVPDRKGRLAPGSRIFLQRPKGDIRMEGFSYLLSGRYNELDGLGQLRNVAGPLNCGLKANPMFCDPAADTMSSMRWVLPHCPIPNPRELFTVEDMFLEYTVTDVYTSLTPKEVASGTVESRFGPFRVIIGPGERVPSSHRYVPDYVLARLMEGDYYSPGIARLELQKVLGEMGSLAPPREASTSEGKESALEEGSYGEEPLVEPNLEEGTPTPSTGARQPKVPTPVVHSLQTATTSAPDFEQPDPDPDVGRVKAEDTGVKKTAPTSNVRKEDSPPDSAGGD